MKMLFLVNYTWTINKSKFNETTSVSVSTDQNESDLTRLQAAQHSFVEWFNETHQDSKLISFKAVPPIKDRRKNGHPVSQWEYLGHLAKPMTEFPQTNEGETESRLVVIDIDGKRKDFVTGYYDHSDGEWVVNGDGLDKVNAKWIDILPIS